MHTKQNKNKTKQNKTKKQVSKQKKTNKTIHTHKQTKQKQKQKQKFSNMHTGLQAQDIFPTVLFVVVWYGRDRENLPSGYKSVFFEWMGWDGWDGMDGMDGGTSTNFALTYVLDTKIQSDFSQFCPFQTDFSQFCHFQR